MPNFEGAPSADSQESSTIETPTEATSTQERAKVEKADNQSELVKTTPAEQLTAIEDKITAQEQEIETITSSLEKTRAGLNEIRTKLGLPPNNEKSSEPPPDEERLEQLKTEQEKLQQQHEELLSQQEKEKLISDEKAKILQEKIDELFKEFESLGAQDMESLTQNGKSAGGQGFESQALGKLDPETVKLLASAFKSGIKLLPQILENLPDLIKKFDDELTSEAEKRVNKRLEEEKKALSEKKELPADNDSKMDTPTATEDKTIPKTEDTLSEAGSQNAPKM